MTSAHLDGALAWHKAGMSIIPVLADGTKRPQLKWEQYQNERATYEQVKQWFTTSPNSGVGIVCGKVSGNLEMLELEARANDGETHSLLVEAMEEAGLGDWWANLLDTGYVASTPSGGLHLVYRITDHDVPGNTKVARRPANAEEIAENPRDRVKVLSETRGEGGYFVAAPTGGTVHKTGDSWSLLTGEPGLKVWELTWNVRCDIIDTIHATLDKMPAPVAAPERPVQPVVRDGVAPGEDWAGKTSWRTLLGDYGWTYHSQMGSEQLWTRPGKDVREGYSASLYYQNSDNLYIWSSSTELPTEEPISKFAFYTFMEHNGDFSAAASALSRAGYGDKKDFSVDISDWFETPRVGNDMGDGTAPVASVVETAAPQVRVSEWTETGVGELLGRLYSGKFRAVPEQKLWRVYEKGLWVRDQERKVEHAAKRVTKLLLDQARQMVQDATENEDDAQLKIANGVYRKAESFRSDRGAKACVSRFGAEAGITVPFEAFDRDVNLLRFENGTLDLRTLELREHRPEDMITLDIPYAYDPQAKAPMFDKFLAESLPDSDVRWYMQRAAGYTVTGKPGEGVWFALYGDTGCGKSTYLKIINAVLGEHARTAAQATFAQRNEGSRAANDLQDIRHARMVMISETKEGQLFNEALIKQYSGGDEMNSHGLYQENGTWENKGVLYMATNHPPRLSADDNANWRRVKLVEFPVSQYNNPNMNPDPKLAEKIIEAEMPGIMNWIIQGLRDYRDHGLGEPQAVTRAVRAHRTDVDPVAQFLNEGVMDGYITVDPDAGIAAPQLHKIFVNWCEDNGYKPFGAQRFGMRLTAMHFQIRRGGNGARIRVGIGIGTRGAFGTMG